MVKVAKLPTSTNHPLPWSKSGWEANTVEHCSQPPCWNASTHTHTTRLCVVPVDEIVIYNINLYLPIPDNFFLKYKKFVLQNVLRLRLFKTYCKLISDLNKHEDHWPLEITTLPSRKDQHQLTVKHSRLGTKHISVTLFGFFFNWP